MKEIENLIHQAITALESEIETVREKPSTDILFNGKRTKTGTANTTDYKFETHQRSIRFAEEVKATFDGKTLTVHPVHFEDNEVTLRFPDDVGLNIDKLHVEWENDFILKRTLSEILKLQDNDNGEHKRLKRLFYPNGDTIPGHDEIEEDGMRNDAQFDAIEKSMRQKTAFIWGPPGTGKTDTLGYIIANYLKTGKKSAVCLQYEPCGGCGPFKCPECT